MNVRLDPKHGVNPMLMNCFYCNKPSGVALLGEITTKMKEGLAEAGAPVGVDGEAPRCGVVMDKEPCHDCKGYMDLGVIVISIDAGKSDDMENPWRTGGWNVMSEGWVRRSITPPELVEEVLEKRICFISDDAWDYNGLPRGPEEQT